MGCRARRTIVFVLFVAMCWQIGAVAQTRTRQKGPARRQPVHAKQVAPPKLPCGDFVAFQVLLDRQGFSPGPIDGKPGVNFTHAIAVFQAARNLEPTGEPDCETWHGLGGDKAEPFITEYVVSDDDVKGPFVEAIPKELTAQASLPALGYTSAIEKLAERFHVAPALLQQMNGETPLAAGATIKVPSITPFDVAAPKPDPKAAPDDVTVVVTREESSVRVKKTDGTLIFFAPVTTGSIHDPLPTGDWQVTSVDWHPVFHYNPKLFWDAKATDTNATLKPGPNNPVGVVWIALSLEHYGLHGTPEPGHVGHTESHGCVRLTNWDAARLAALVKPGTPVMFRDR